MKNKILLKVFLAILVAVFAGWLTGPNTSLFGITYVRIYNLIGQLFLNALALVVVPLVVSSIITGSARMGRDHSFGSLGAKTLGFFLGTSMLAVLVGLFFSLIILPSGTTTNLVSHADTARLSQIAAQTHQIDSFGKISDLLFKLIPSNILAAASQGQMLGLIMFSLVFGYFVSKIDEKPAEIILGFFQGVFQIMMGITHLVMKALPIGVFGLVAKVIATTGLDTFQSVALYTSTVLASMLAYGFVVLPLLLAFVAQVNPFAHIRAVLPALFTAFSTSSSAAALPITIECVEKRVGVSNRICSFTVPLGSSLNLSGTALYQCVSTLFIAYVYSIDLSYTTLSLVALMSVLTSTGMAGIPSASLISIVIILNTIGVPAEGIGLILAVERVLDMCRTTINVFGNTCCAVLIARLEGEKDILASPLTRAKAMG